MMGMTLDTEAKEQENSDASKCLGLAVDLLTSTSTHILYPIIVDY